MDSEIKVPLIMQLRTYLCNHIDVAEQHHYNNNVQESLVTPLTLIYNKYLKEGILPDSWKEATVVRRVPRELLAIINQ